MYSMVSSMGLPLKQILQYSTAGVGIVDGAVDAGVGAAVEATVDLAVGAAVVYLAVDGIVAGVLDTEPAVE